MEITIHRGDASELDAFILLSRQVRAGMEHQEWFAIDPDEEQRALMEDGSLIFWLAEAEGDLAAGFSVIRPGLREFNLGWELGLSEQELLRVVHMDTAAVSPAYRGRGLQRRLMALAEAGLKGGILLCTIHPDNAYSLRNALALGYRIEKRVQRYGSVRNILRKDL